MMIWVVKQVGMKYITYPYINAVCYLCFVIVDNDVLCYRVNVVSLLGSVAAAWNLYLVCRTPAR